MFAKFIAGILAGMILAPFTLAQSEEDWKYAVELYGWLPNIDIQNEDGTSSKITLDDIVDNLEMGAMTSFGAARGKWRFASDVLYMDLSADDGALVQRCQIDRRRIPSPVR